jgi:hypothetical protein
MGIKAMPKRQKGHGPTARPEVGKETKQSFNLFQDVFQFFV